MPPARVIDAAGALIRFSTTSAVFRLNCKAGVAGSVLRMMSPVPSEPVAVLLPS